MDDEVAVEADLKKETEAAYGITIDDDTFEREAEIIWLPKSKVTYDEFEKTFWVPIWLAEEKGLI